LNSHMRANPWLIAPGAGKPYDTEGSVLAFRPVEE
jgi:hypothetical protein